MHKIRKTISHWTDRSEQFTKFYKNLKRITFFHKSIKHVIRWRKGINIFFNNTSTLVVFGIRIRIFFLAKLLLFE